MTQINFRVCDTLVFVLPDIKRLDTGVDAGHADGQELHWSVGIWGQLVLLGGSHCQVYVLLLGNMHTICQHLYHPSVCDNHPGTWGTGGKLINPPELCVDGRCHSPPA